MARNKSVGMKVFAIAGKSFLIVIMLMLVGMISYKFTMKYYEVTEGEDATGSGVLDIVGDVSADEISRNVIFSVDSESGKIKSVVIEILNTLTGNLDYITVPDSYQMVINQEMYQRLYAAGVDVPQVMKLGQLNKYFKDNTAYEYGILLMEGSLGIDIGYYTAMSVEEFDRIFVMDEETGYYKLADSLLSEVSSFSDADGMEEFIKDRYDNYTSNLKVKTKLKYAECYANIKPELVYYHIIPGAVVDGSYDADEKLTEMLYKQIIEDSTHTVVQGDIVNVSSKGLNIKVLNGSGGEGIAARVKGILEADGYPVAKIADNPEIIENTVIQVREEGMGKDVKTYFKGASLEVTEVEEGIDIVIIVGKADVNI